MSDSIHNLLSYIEANNISGLKFELSLAINVYYQWYSEVIRELIYELDDHIYFYETFNKFGFINDKLKAISKYINASKKAIFLKRLDLSDNLD